MNLPNRKPNRLKDYDYRTPGAYFITLCTKNRLPLLSEIVGDDAHIVPKPWGIVAEKYIKSIPGMDRYVIMPNHIHLIIKIETGTMWASSPTQSVSQNIKSFKTLVSKELNTSIWQRSFYDHIIRDEEDYLKICQYMQSNPAKWKEDRFFYAP